MSGIMRYITVPEAGKLVGLGPKAMHELIDHGVIRAIKPKKQRRVLLADVLRFRDGVIDDCSRANEPLVTEDLLAD